MENQDSGYILEMKNCRKEFPGVVALDNVSLFVKRGEVHALMGENGAGKSTIMKILAGIYQLDEGEVLFNGKPFIAKNPKDSLVKGISMIHQELNMIPDMTVEENLFMGRESVGRLGVIKKKELVASAKKQFEELGIDIKVNAKIRDLSVAQMQLVEIVKATSYNADVIIMDEPTSAITENEVKKLFEIIAMLKEQNKAIIYISHKMDEIYNIADRVTVLRDGKLIGSKPINAITEDELVSLMVGRQLTEVYHKTTTKNKNFDENEILFEVNGLTREKEFENISFNVKKGEILGIYGLMGAGRTETVETIFGLRKPDSGTVKIRGKELTKHTPKEAIDNGLAFISEDRKLYGCNLIGSVKDNITSVYLKKVLKGNLIVDFNKENVKADSYIKLLQIKTPTKESKVGNLSGGNQQKVIIAKWLFGEPDLIIMDEPTRGIDIGAKSEIYKIMDQITQEGKSVIMISSEMPELIGMSDRVIVLHEGIQTGEFERANIKQELILESAINDGKRGEN